MARPSPLAVWTVDHDSVQICWGDLPPGQIRFSAADSAITIDHGAGPGGVVLDHLPSGRALTARVTLPSGQVEELAFATLAPPPGQQLARIATVSDLHLGANRWGFFKTMSEARAGLADQYDRPAPYRCARAAIAEAEAWGAQHLVIKGDAAHHRRADDFAQLDDLVDEFPSLAMLLIPGNHDVDFLEKIDMPTAFGQRRLPLVRGVEHLDLPGLRLIVGDTTIEGEGRGTTDRIGADLLAAAGESDRPVLMAVHQHFQVHSFITYWPPGIPAPESTRFVTDLKKVKPDTILTSGHTHRNRVHRAPDTVTHTEVASTRDWPGVWAGYTIFEGGVIQSVRRIQAPEAISWQEYSKNAVGGLWQRWAPALSPTGPFSTPGRTDAHCADRRIEFRVL